MKVLIVNTYDRGGAANACNRLHLSLVSKNINSSVLLRYKQDSWPRSFSYNSINKNKSILSKMQKQFRIGKKLLLSPSEVKESEERNFIFSREEGLEMFSFPNSGIDITQSALYKEADIINLHWVANFLDFKTFFRKNKKPVVWTLHDMNPFSGGEHYTENFLGVDEFGFPVERIKLPIEQYFSKKNIIIKKKALRRFKNLNIVSPSKWLLNEAGKSEIFRGLRIHHIPYGIDSKIYSPKERSKSRELFNIPLDKKVILFVSHVVNNNRKGFLYLERAFRRLSGNNIFLCAIGDKNFEFESGKNFVQLGYIQDEVLMSHAYSAADVFVIPSLMDNLPNTVIESLLCGTPVIGFPVGGIPEMIKEGENGLITKDISVQSLYETIICFLNSIENYDRDKIRELAVHKYDSKIQAEKYIALFNSIA